MTRLTDEELRELREAATAASPGPWEVCRAPVPSGGFTAAHWVQTRNARAIDAGVAAGDRMDDPQGAADARHIATADPSTVLRLVEEVERLRAVHRAAAPHPSEGESDA